MNKLNPHVTCSLPLLCACAHARTSSDIAQCIPQIFHVPCFCFCFAAIVAELCCCYFLVMPSTNDVTLASMMLVVVIVQYQYRFACMCAFLRQIQNIDGIYRIDLRTLSTIFLHFQTMRMGWCQRRQKWKTCQKNATKTFIQLQSEMNANQPSPAQHCPTQTERYTIQSRQASKTMNVSNANVFILNAICTIISCLSSF